MIKNGLVLLIMLLSSIAKAQSFPNRIQNKIVSLGLYDIDKVGSIKNAQRLVHYLDSHGRSLEILPGYVWEQLLVRQYDFVVQNGLTSLQLRLGLPLASEYHSQSRFDLNLPILEFLHSNLTQFKVSEQRSVLIKLEEVYRNSNDMKKAIEIRNERIQKKFIQTFWEIYRDCKLYDLAIKDFKLFEKIPHEEGTAHSRYYMYLGDMFFDNGQLDSARKYFEIGLVHAKNFISNNKHLSDFELIAPYYYRGLFTGNIALCDVKEGKYAKAISPILYDISFSKENPGNKIYKWIFLADCYLHLKQPQVSKRYLDSANKYIVGKKIKRDFLKLYETCSFYFKEKGQFDSAYYYTQLYSRFSDSLNIRVQKSQAVLLLAQLEIDKRRADLVKAHLNLEKVTIQSKFQRNQMIVLYVSLLAAVIIGAVLYYLNIQKTRTNFIIEAQVKHNEALLKELHHRVKNNLQLMYSLLSLQKRTDKNPTNKSLISSAQSRIQTMALVHQQLYTTGEYEAVDLPSYIRTLMTHLQDIYKMTSRNVRVNYDMLESLPLPIENIISIGLIINEAVSNSYKYAFVNRNKGEIFISLNKVEDKIELIVKDDGVGCDIILDSNKTLGVRLIQVMVSQLNSIYSLETKNGVTHQILFSKKS